MTIDKLIKINNYIEAELEEKYSSYGLTINQAELLIYFYQFGDNQINATSALKELGIDKRLMSLALKALEAKAYISRYPNQLDKRQKDIELSMSALEVCEDIISIKEQVNAEFEASLSSAQITMINQLELEKL